MSNPFRPTPLTTAQRQLVADNIGLVGLHLRKHIAHIRMPTRSREWEDLFQEGCLGLIQAARLYDPASGMPFVAFALPRIHTAVTRALRASFHTVSVPVYPRSRGSADLEPPKVLAFDSDPVDADGHAHRPHDLKPDRTTLGDQLRARLDIAVRDAAAASKNERCIRQDREMLIDRIIADRIAVPEPSARLPLREIARETGSSYSRVLQAERRLLRDIKSQLEQDKCIQWLRIAARNDPRGFDAPYKRDANPGCPHDRSDPKTRPASRSRPDNPGHREPITDSSPSRRTDADSDAPRRRNRPARSRSPE